MSFGTAGDNFNPVPIINDTNVPPPSAYTMEYEDVSSSEAGRTEDLTMYKMKRGTVVKISLEYNCIDDADTMQTLLNVFDDENFYVKYYDPYTKDYTTKLFYCGNRTMPMYSAVLGIWTNFKVNITSVYKVR